VLAPFLATLSALAPTNGASSAEFDASLQLDAGSTGSGIAYSTSGGGWLGGGVGLDATLFLRPVIDDEAAPPLQPFLQRRPRLHFDLGGSFISVKPTPLISPQASSLTNGPGSMGTFSTAVSGEGYLGPWFYLSGGVELGYTVRQSPALVLTSVPTPPSQNYSELVLHPWLSLGVRWDDLLLFAGWGPTAVRFNDYSAQVPFWGSAFVGGHAVVRRFVELGVRLDVLDQGALVQAWVNVWLYRRLGLGFALQGGHGAFVDSSTVFDRAGGEISLSYWIKPRVGLSLAYAPSWRGIPDYPSSDEVRHLLTLGVAWRIGSQLPEAH
jgi:hypothetical protein